MQVEINVQLLTQGICMLKGSIKKFMLITIYLLNTQNSVIAEEMIIGEETISNINFVFEAAPKDSVFTDGPTTHLAEKNTDIHIEALISWSQNSNIPGQIPGSHLPYLDVQAKVINEKTDEVLVVNLVPHINLSDGYHYARNIQLPGNTDDIFTVHFLIKPDESLLSYHYDWKEAYGMPIINTTEFKYKNLNFLEISKKSRR